MRSVALGQVVYWEATFRSTLGVLTNPTTVTFTVQAPSGVETSYVYGTDSEVTRSSTGIYRMTLQLNTSGEWYCRVVGTGTVEACDETLQPINVRTSRFGDYVAPS
jgi:hypothetical protein